jgi:tetratricopeptide (TPR) repeat protein
VRILARLVRMKGDKERGLNEIRLAMEKGRFARTAARLFLIGILNNNEKDYDEALKLVREGRVRYPDSSFFHLLEMITLENAGRWRELRVLSEDYLRRIRGREPSYPSHYVHRGYFFLGNSHLGEGHAALAAELYTESLNDFSSSDRWTTWTYLNRGRAYDRLDERKKALADYETVLKRRDVWGLHDLARRFMRNPDEGEFQRKG